MGPRLPVFCCHSRYLLATRLSDGGNQRVLQRFWSSRIYQLHSNLQQVTTIKGRVPRVSQNDQESQSSSQRCCFPRGHQRHGAEGDLERASSVQFQSITRSKLNTASTHNHQINSRGHRIATILQAGPALGFYKIPPGFSKMIMRRFRPTGAQAEVVDTTLLYLWDICSQ
jgi:hypothetical protein